MNLGVIVAGGLVIFLGDVLLILLFYAYGQRQASSRPEPPKGHT